MIAANIVIRPDTEKRTGLPSQREHSQNGLLLGDQRLHTVPRKRHHSLKPLIIENLMLCSSLNFHQFAASGHDKIHVDIGARVFYRRRIKLLRFLPKAHENYSNAGARRMI